MKLNLVTARTGIQWVKLGARTFLRQPLALSGLFFMFLAILSLVMVLPYIGTLIALALLPAATLGFMAATLEASRGKFPMPTILVSAFRAGRERVSSMLSLGAMYAAAVLGIMGISALVDGGQFARLYLVGGKVTAEVLQAAEFRNAMWLALALYLPMSMMFWHAPALVHWHGVTPVKSLFFSLVACLRNFWAFTVYAVLWFAVFVAAMLLVSLVGGLMGGPTLVGVVMMPVMLLLMAMFFTSMYFSFKDSFLADDNAPLSEGELT